MSEHQIALCVLVPLVLGYCVALLRNAVQAAREHREMRRGRIREKAHRLVQEDRQRRR